MHQPFRVAAFIAFVTSCYASVSPLTPAQTPVIGQQSTIQWTKDATGEWKNMTIQLMDGNNWDMQVLQEIASGLDGTTLETYTWTVPDVSSLSPIYFFQFTNNGDITTATWTTRWAITDSTGQTSAPASSIQPAGNTIGWGVASIIGGQDAVSNTSLSSSLPASQTSMSSSVVSSTSSQGAASSTSSPASSSSSPLSSASSSISLSSTSDASTITGSWISGLVATLLAAYVVV